MGEQDIIYYNLSLFNDRSNNVKAEIYNRTQGAIVSDPSQYEGSIVRFTVDANWPLFIPVIPDASQPLVTNMSITFSYLGVKYQQFIPITVEEAKNGVFDFNVFLANLNAAATTAFNLLPGGHPGAYPPYFALNPITSLISMYVDDGWLDDSGILIYFNSYLQDLLGLPFNFQNAPPSINGTDYQIAVKGYAPLLPESGSRAGYPYDLNSLTGNILQVSQEFIQLSEFSDIATVMFTSSLLGIATEYVPTTALTSQAGTTNNNFIPIITDFVISRDDAKPRDNSFVYLPTAEYRLFSFKGNTPITGIDIKAYYTTYDGKVMPLSLPPGGSMTLKLMFRKKNQK